MTFWKWLKTTFLPRKSASAQQSENPSTIVYSKGKVCVSDRLSMPANVQDLDGLGIMMCFEENGMNVMMDRDMFEYAYGKRKGTLPAQEDIDALRTRVNRLCVLEGAMCQGKAFSSNILFESSAPSVVETFFNSLKIVTDPSTFSHCSCLGGPTIELYQDDELIATIGIHHGKTIRWNRWQHDAQLLDSQRLVNWFHLQKISPYRLESIYQRGNQFLFEKKPPSEQMINVVLDKAVALAEANQFDAAIKLCEEGFRHAPSHRGLLLLRGEIFANTMRWQEALVDLKAAIQHGMRVASVYQKIAIVLKQLQRPQEALIALNNALYFADSEAAPRLHLMRGQLLADQNKLQEALADFSTAHSLAPTMSEPLMLRGLNYHAMGQLEAAMADYQKACQLLQATNTPESSLEVKQQLANCYCRMGDLNIDLFQEAEAEANFAKARNTMPIVAHATEGQIWLRRGEWTKSLHAWTEYLKLAPDDSLAWLERSIAHQATGNWEAALADINHSLNLNAAQTPAYGKRAELAIRQNRLEDALADYIRHLDRFPNDAQARWHCSVLYQAQGNAAQALKEQQLAQQLVPDHPLICNRLAWLLATLPDDTLRDGTRAVELARKACELTRYADSELLDTLAAALAECKDYDEASRWQSLAVNITTSPQQAVDRRKRLELYHSRQPYRLPAQPALTKLPI